MGVNAYIKKTIMDNNQYVVMFVPKEVHTGGERYLMEVFVYFQRQGLHVEPIYIKQSDQERRGISLILNCLADSFRYYFQVRKLDNLSEVIFFEDFHLHPRLWLFNILMGFTTGKLRFIVLMQLALFYHKELKRRWVGWLDRVVVRQFLRKSSLILTNSNFTKQEVSSLGIDLRKVRVIYCGYEGYLETELTPKKMDHREQKRILFVGQCAEYKGLEFLLQAVSMLSESGAILDVVGNTAAEPEYFSQLNKTIEELEIHYQVIFHGHISDKAELAKFYQNSDVFVLPSLVEGFGIVLLDAMSFALPVVATRVGAIPELVEDGVNGLLVPPADPLALSKAIDHLLGSSALRERYGRAGYDFVSTHREFFSWEAVGERALEAMKPLLKEIKC